LLVPHTLPTGVRYSSTNTGLFNVTLGDLLVIVYDGSFTDIMSLIRSRGQETRVARAAEGPYPTPLSTLPPRTINMLYKFSYKEGKLRKNQCILTGCVVQFSQLNKSTYKQEIHYEE
jgi:hypothetical protein